MKLVLLKKNADTTDRTYYIDEGCVITENYNETLDSAVVRISHQEEQINIEPFDKVILIDENNHLPQRYMVVDTYVETMESLDPYIYSYEINLFSETKELECVILPNLGITQIQGVKMTVIDYIQRYMYLYCPKVRYDGDFVRKYKIATNHNGTGILLSEKFNVECPEMQWNNPTLREVLTNLMMVVDCIPVLKNNVLDYIDLTEVKNPLDTDRTNYIQRSQSSEDYISELKTNLVNVMQTSLDGVKQTVNRMEHLTFRAEGDGYVVTDQNICLKTQFPILEINHLWMYFQCFARQQQSGADGWVIRTYKVDLCNLPLISGGYEKLVYEQTEFNSLPKARYNPTDFSNKVQNMCVYYQRYSNTISGFSQLSQEYWLFNQKISTLNIIKDLIVENCYDVNGWEAPAATTGADGVEGTNVYFSTFFDIEYKTTGDAVFKASKDIAPTHERVVADNQSFSFVDAYNQGFMEYQKANRLGNKQLHINSRYEDNFSNITKIGDYYDDNIIYQVQYQIYKNHIEVNSIATKNYILRDYFTGVKAKIRAWAYAPASESFTRHDLEKYYLEFSKSRKNEVGTVPEITSYFLSPLSPSYIRPLKYVFVTTKTYTATYPDTSNAFSIDLLGRIVGNSIVFTFGFDDNFNVFKRVSHELESSNIDANYLGVNGTPRNILHIRQDFTNRYGGIPLEDAKYVGDNGEINYLDYKLTYTMDDPDVLYDTDDVLMNANDSSKFFLYRVCQLPLVSNTLYTSYVKLEGRKFIYKDNKEIPKLSLQYEFCSDTHDIVFTKKFLQLQECIRELTAQEQQTQHKAFSQQIALNEWAQIGGTYKVNAPQPTNITGIGGEGYAGSYSLSLPSLVGKTLSSYSISGGITGYNNTVNFDSTTGTFSGTLYSTSNDPSMFFGTISYVVSGEETGYWIYNNQFYHPELANQRVTNIEITPGFSPGINDTISYSFTQATGTFSVYIKTFTQPVQGMFFIIDYDVVLSDGTYVANTIKIYQDSASNFNWRNPSLGNASIASNAYLSLTHYTTSTRIMVNGVTDYNNHVYYITDNDDNILLAVKGTNTIYLNTLLSRDYNIYDANRNVIGHI